MIYIGYQGIGKSTLCKSQIKAIDLESSLFTYPNENQEMKRDPNWYKPYVNIAKDLSDQGYSVFVSSHKEVRTELRNYTKCVAIVPDLSLKDEWVFKLKDRYNMEETSGDPNAEKHKFAYLNAEACYEENIKDIMNDIENVIIIPNMKYKLKELINKYITEKYPRKEWEKYFISICDYLRYVKES